MKLASVEIITEIQDHLNAERLEVAQIMGWQSIVKKGEFKTGDKVVFIVIDTVLPQAPWSEFLIDKNRPDRRIRLNTVKLRGLPSQGLVLPLSVLGEYTGSLDEGTDVTEILGVQKYEKPLAACLAGQARSNFPNHLIHKTDEDNGLSNLNIVQEVLGNLQTDITITRKLDGSSCTIIIEDGKIEQVCSRSLSLVENPDNAFWKVALELTIPEGWSGILQGEVCGPGIQGNQLGLSKPTLFVFQIKTNKEYLFYSVMKFICDEILHCEVVPLVYQGAPKTLQEIIELADSQVLPNGQPAEGLVIRPWHYPARGIDRPLGFKIINRNFKDS